MFISSRSSSSISRTTWSKTSLRAWNLADQLSRASLSIVNNIAEGAGKFSKGDKRRYYLSAAGSSTESAAMLDVCLRRRLITDDVHRRGKQQLDRIVAMLVALAKSLQG